MAGKISAIVAAVALLALPAAAPAAKGGHGRGHSDKAHGKSRGCAKVSTRGFQVTGTLVSAGEGTVTLTVTAANKHARESGELADQDAARKGVQVKGATYTVPAGDVFELRLGDDGTLVPAAGDRVKVKGRIAVTKKRCAADGASTADRYASPDVTRVSISHPEPETPEAPEAPETETQS
jgi:hypothetical protein